ncbi:MAG: putative LPS assembly protein LptD [Bacteroidota bacterium]
MTGYSQDKPNNLDKNLAKNIDSIAIKQQDTIKTDSVKVTKEFLEGNISHKALDYVKNDFINERVILYNEAELKYKDIELKAGEIIIDYKSSLAYAKGIIDSLGKYTQKPQFKQGNQQSEQDSLIYNFNTEKALIYHSKTEQQGVIITGDLTKKEDDSTFYVNKARFTTSQKDKPDYYIQTSNIKVVPNSKIVGGMSNLVIADVPTPLFLPFFYAPITQGRASGFLIPTWGENSNQGFFLQNGGYYFAINDYVDLAVLGDIYTNGSWGIRTESNYAVKYKFTGNFSFRYENLINSQLGFPDYSRSTNFFLRWSHSQASQANPNSRFSTSVNFGSSNFFRHSLNETSSPFYLVNTFSSSINYYKKFVGTPFNLNASITHTQNTNTDKVDVNLPSLQFNMDRIYPFAPKSGAKKNVIQNIGLTYNMNAQNRISTTGEELFTSNVLDNARSGVQHNISMGTNMKAFKYFTISPNATYKDIWYFKTIEKNWDPTVEKVVTDTIQGFSTFREYSANVSASTTLYGMYNFKKSRLRAIRHTVRPSASLIYRPDFGTYYDEYQASLDPEDIQEYNKFQNGIFGGPTKGKLNSIGLSLNNSLEAKLMDKDSEEEDEAQKVMLLNNLNFSTSYNMAIDSLNWSPLRMTAGTQLLNNKLNINFNATMDPYAINANGSRIDKFNINNGGSLFRLVNAGLSSNYAISSKEIGKNKNKQSGQKNKEASDQSTSDPMFGKSITNRDSDLNNTKKDDVKVAKLFNTVMPWNLSFRYSLNYSNARGESQISTNSLQVSGDLEFSPKWHVGISSGYDFKDKGVTYTQLRFERDLDSWHFSFNWVPFGDRATYYFFIGVKSSALSDLKYDKRNVPDKRLF